MDPIVVAGLRVLAIVFAVGLVIFVHELGHFLVARSVGVLVERFSIGFGPVLFCLKRGETEYVLSLIPLGGYVKMLGQSDLPEAEETLDDARSYQNQPVGKRMAIISAGVVMNVAFGFVCYVVAFHLGVPYQLPVIGMAAPGKPAWAAGLRAGDVVAAIDGRPVPDFETLVNAVALTRPPRDTLRIEIDREGRRKVFEVAPVQEDLKPMIGVGPSAGLELIPQLPTEPYSPAARANNPELEGGDRILAVDGHEVRSHYQLVEQLFARHDREVLLTVHRRAVDDRPGPTVTVKLDPNFVRHLGLQMGIGEIVERGVQRGSPATRALDLAGKPVPIQPSDVIKAVDGVEDFDPMRLPDLVGAKAGQPVELTLIRPGTQTREIKLTVVPERVPTWIDFPESVIETADRALSIPSLGVAYRVSNRVRKLLDGFPAAEADPRIQPDDEITNVEFTLERFGKVETPKFSVTENQWPTVFWSMQPSSVRKVKLTVARPGVEAPFAVLLEPKPDPSWPFYWRGLHFGAAYDELKTDTIAQALRAGFDKTRNLITTVYLHLRGLLFIGTLSPKTLGGPIRIASIAYELSDDLSESIYFFGFLSINLAIVNFLPIPILDGGHMVFLTYELLMRRRPGERAVLAANYVGLFLIVGLVVYVLALDILWWVQRAWT